MEKEVRNISEKIILDRMEEFLVFMDETGDSKVHQDIRMYEHPTVYPVSTLAAIVIEKEKYENITLPRMLILKNKLFKNKEVHFHSNEIRRKDGIFKIFLDKKIYDYFKFEIIEICKDSNIQIITSSINKIKLLEQKEKLNRSGTDYDIGDLYIKNIEWVLEKVSDLIKTKKAILIFEMQGKKETKSVKTLIAHLHENGDFYSDKNTFKNISKDILFLVKKII